jgi:flagellar biosynthesis component FlhA
MAAVVVALLALLVGGSKMLWALLAGVVVLAGYAQRLGRQQQTIRSQSHQQRDNKQRSDRPDPRPETVAAEILYSADGSGGGGAVSAAGGRQ